MQNNMELKDKIVLVTGSSSGIGRELAIKFSERGAYVIITYNSNLDDGKNTLKLCEQAGKAMLLHLNVKELKSIKECVKGIINKFGKIDILVNNAGTISQKNLVSQTDEEITNQIETNLIGMIRVTKEVLPAMQKTAGMIINISSGAGKKGKENLSIYSASKFGVIGFTESLAKELPGNIKVFSLNPGVTSTKMTGFVGNPPKKIAESIIKIISGEVKVESGENFDVWRLLEQ